MAAEENARIDPETVAALYQKYGEELRCFLLGMLRDIHLANDLVQATFVKAAEAGHTARQESLKAWLFRVGYVEAMIVLRRRKAGERAHTQAAWLLPEFHNPADEPVIRREEIDRVKNALLELPIDQQQIVRMRIYENKTFARIAQELKIPLGTALGRMRIALEKLRRKLDNNPSGEKS